MTKRIDILQATADTVTITRSDFDDLIRAAEDADDLAAVAAHDAEEAHAGREVARSVYLTGEEVARLLEGASPLKVWREKRGFSQRALAEAAGVQPGYVAEIETGKKPGSADAWLRLSSVLRVAIADLMQRDQTMRRHEYGPVIVQWYGVLPGAMISAGGQCHEKQFPTLAEALHEVRRNWHSVMHRQPVIFDLKTRFPIYDARELWELETSAGGDERDHAL